MPSGLSDTDPAVERFHLDLLRRAGPARRFQLAQSLSQDVIHLTRAGLRRRHPELTERERSLRFVALCYGEQLAEGLRADLERRGT